MFYSMRNSYVVLGVEDVEFCSNVNFGSRKDFSDITTPTGFESSFNIATHWKTDSSPCGIDHKWIKFRMKWNSGVNETEVSDHDLNFTNFTYH